MMEQEKVETSSSVFQVLGRLDKKAKEEKVQEEMHTLKVWEKIQEREKSAREGNNYQRADPKGGTMAMQWIPQGV